MADDLSSLAKVSFSIFFFYLSNVPCCLVPSNLSKHGVEDSIFDFVLTWGGTWNCPIWLLKITPTNMCAFEVNGYLAFDWVASLRCKILWGFNLFMCWINLFLCVLLYKYKNRFKICGYRMFCLWRVWRVPLWCGGLLFWPLQWSLACIYVQFVWSR